MDRRRLDLKLGLPGEDQAVLSLGYSSSNYCNTQINSTNKTNFGGKREFLQKFEAKPEERESQCQKLISSEKPAEKKVLSSSTWSSPPLPAETQNLQHQFQPPFLQLNYQLTSKSLPNMAEKTQLHCLDKKGFSIPDKPPKAANSTVVPNSSHKRVAPAPVVGWPPIRSFRKNLACNSSTKPVSGSSPSDNLKEIMGRKSESSRTNGLFVKINMDGVPIGRKIDLNAYESYEKLSYAIDELFRGLLAAQRDAPPGEGENKVDKSTVTGLIDTREEYTLVYEDNEGDRMLVGDVPWHMFVSTAKRLRVLRSSELSTFQFARSKQEKASST